MWPEDKEGNASDEDGEHDADDIETQVAKELASIKRPRKEHRFGESVHVS